MLCFSFWPLSLKRRDSMEHFLTNYCSNAAKLNLIAFKYKIFNFITSHAPWRTAMNLTFMIDLKIRVSHWLWRCSVGINYSKVITCVLSTNYAPHSVEPTAGSVFWKIPFPLACNQAKAFTFHTFIGRFTFHTVFFSRFFTKTFMLKVNIYMLLK